MMPITIEHEGKEIQVWTQEEVDAEVKGLKVTNDNLKAEKQEALDKVKESKESARVAEEAKAKAEGDNEALKRIAEEREAEKRQAVEDERKRYSDLLHMTKQEKVENFLTGVLDDVKTADDTRRKHLRKLLKADYDFDFDIESGEYTVKGENVSNVDELKKVLKEGDEYRYYLAGSGATGGGAAGSNGTGGSSKTFSEYTGAELSEIRRQDPSHYERLRAEQYAG